MENPQKEQVLVFGGTFNPPTTAHEAITAACLELPQFDAVWLMPSGERTDKQMTTSDEHRLRMLELLKKEAFATDDRLIVSDFELKLPSPTETSQTVARLALAHANTEFWFAFGADAYLSMPQWQGGAELQQGLNIVVFDRAQGDIAEASNLRFMKVPACAGVSSSRARQEIIQGELVTSCASTAVQAYIVQYALYDGTS